MGEAAFVTTRDARIAYLEHGPREGRPLLLVHGFPDDARTWDALVPPLVDAGFRTIAPWVRGFGPTTLAEGAARTGEIAALAADVLALADALEFEQFDYVGHDWGARAGYAAAVLAPERFRSLTALAVAYGTNVAAQRLSVDQGRAYWYQWYFATPRGEEELRTNRHAFCRSLWGHWSPGWHPTSEEYDVTAVSFANPDFVPIVLSSYRQRWGFVPGAERYAAERAALEGAPHVTVPTLALLGRDDGATLPASADGSAALFDAPYEVRIVPDCGHFLQRERPAVVADALLAHLRERDAV
ncbi:MAG TPA: alpha/beta hydrolase [Candidatus Sulfotelmatobacter sp.]|nr:alpha/beta hydrolase [Candidatus Sulfotelmatobacter sp.]